MNKTKDQEVIVQALKARGYNDIEINDALKEIEAKGLTFQDFVAEFIKKADNDPHSINKKNCQSGKCMAWDLDKKLR